MTQVLGQWQLHSNRTGDSSVVGGHNPASLSVWISVRGVPTTELEDGGVLPRAGVPSLASASCLLRWVPQLP